MTVIATKTESTASAVRKTVLASEDRVWRAEDFEGASAAVNSELRRLVGAGELRRVRRGIYWRGRTTRFGMASLREGDALRSILPSDEAIGATGWYASNLLGLSTQISPVEALATTHRPPTGFKQLKLVDRSGRTGRRTAKLNDLEVTVLEALEGWDDHVEVSSLDARRLFADLMASDGVRVKALVAASETEPAVVRERLRAVLRASGREDDALGIRRARSESSRRRALEPVGLAG